MDKTVALSLVYVLPIACDGKDRMSCKASFARNGSTAYYAITAPPTNPNIASGVKK